VARNSLPEANMVPAGTKGPVPGILEVSAAKLPALLRRPANSSAAEVAMGFQALHRLVESLPLTSEEFCFVHNWLTSAQALWEAGHATAAHYQAAVVMRKLGLETNGL